MRSATPRPPRLITLILLAGLSVISLNLFLPSLPNMAEGFGTSFAVMNLAVAGFAAATAVLQLVVGPLSDRYGRRPVILGALAIFGLASLGCALATDIWVFLAFRFVQGVVIAGYTVSMAIIRETTKPGEAASLLGYVTMAWAVAPMLGPIAGGALDDFFGWRASFWALVLGCGAIAALCWVDLGETNTTPSRTMLMQLRLYRKLLRSRRFWGYALTMALSTGGFYAYLGGAPVVATATFGLSPGWLGVLLGSITGGFMAGSFLSGQLGTKLPLTTLILIGRAVACGGLLAGLGLLAIGSVTLWGVFGACLLMGVGNGLTLPASSAGALQVAPNLAGTAAGLSGALTVGGGALISLLTGVVMSDTPSPERLLGMMLAASALAAVSTAYIRWGLGEKG